MNLPVPENKIKLHSKIGIASFVIGILNLLAFILFMVYELHTLNSSFDPDTIIEVVFGSIAAAIVFILIQIAGLVTGIISFFQKDTKRLFGILGVVIAVLNVIFLALTMLIVSMSGATF